VPFTLVLLENTGQKTD